MRRRRPSWRAPGPAVQPVAAGLLSEGLTGRDIAAIVSRQLGAMTRRAAVLAERQMKADGHGEPPQPYAFVVLGSAGRGESLLATDQDNALIFADGAPDGAGGPLVRDARRACRADSARGGRALLQGRRHGEERGMARFGRDLARAHRPLGRALQSAGPAQCRYLLRPALRARRRRHGGGALARRVRSRQGQGGFRQAPGRGGGHGAAGARLVRPFHDRAGPRRSEEGGAVRHRQRRTGARDLSSRRGAFDAGAARRRQGGAAQRRERSRHAQGRARRVHRHDPRPAARRHRARRGADQHRRGRSS